MVAALAKYEPVIGLEVRVNAAIPEDLYRGG